MLFLAVWAVVLVLLAVWSSVVWAGQALLAGTLAHAGAIGAGGSWQLPEALTQWLPVVMAEWLISTLETLTPQLQSLAGWLPSLAGGVTFLSWVVWSLGALLLLGGGLLAHVMVVLWRKSRRSSMPHVVPAH